MDQLCDQCEHWCYCVVPSVGNDVRNGIVSPGLVEVVASVGND